MINKETIRFISEHAGEDVSKLAFRGCKNPNVDMQEALQQIAGRQAARTKLPSWASRSDLYFPPHLALEQCSSEETARYKAEIAGLGKRLVDLTTGFGVDAAYMAPNFRTATCIEQQLTLTVIATYNFARLGLTHVDMVNGDCRIYLEKMEPADLIMIDPARRDDNGQRTYSIADCQPNVLEMMGLMTEKARRILIKLSPMLDIHKAVSDISATGKGYVSEVHVVAVRNECKELLLLVTGDKTDRIKTVCVNLTGDGCREVFEYETPDDSERLNETVGCLTPAGVRMQRYVYEPNAAIMKAGCFDRLEAQFGIRQIDSNSHLFVTEQPLLGFPGRGFTIESVCSMNKWELKEAIGHLDRANISVRNFPMSAKELRDRLKLSDGGDTYIFGTTVRGEKVLIVGKRKPK